MLTRFIAGFIASAIALSASPAAASTISFDPGLAADDVLLYQQLGYDVTFSGGLGRGDLPTGDVCSPSCADNASRYARVAYSVYNDSLVIERTDGAAFSLLSFEGAEGLTVNTPDWWAAGIAVTGYLPGGGTIVQSFWLDEVMDGAGGAADFQHFVLGAAFTQLLRAEFSAIGTLGAIDDAFAVDNIEVEAAVPEPASLLLVATGLAGVVARRRGRRQ